MLGAAPAPKRVLAAEPFDSDRFNIIPAVAPWPKTKPVDSDYPKNLPANLPAALPTPPPVLSPGPLAQCATTVREVLTKNKRLSFLQLLSSSPEGKAVLDGKMAATVLAPADAAVDALQLNASSDPLAQSTVALYHVLQGKLSLDKLLKQPGLYRNSTLMKADCPTAFQTLTVLPGNTTTVQCVRLGGAEGLREAVFLRA